MCSFHMVGRGSFSGFFLCEDERARIHWSGWSKIGAKKHCSHRQLRQEGGKTLDHISLFSDFAYIWLYLCLLFGWCVVVVIRVDGCRT